MYPYHMKIPDTLEDLMGDKPRKKIPRSEAIEKTEKILDAMQFSIATMSALVVRSAQMGIADRDEKAKRINLKCAQAIDTLSSYCHVMQESLKALKNGEAIEGVAD